MDLELPTPPEIVPQEPTAPRGPWSFLREALPGGGSGPGLELLAAWVLLQVLPATLWAQHLRSKAGWSALPAYWGEQLSARDAWELVVNGGLDQEPTGWLAPLAMIFCLLWALWAGWRLQARVVGVRPGLGAWLWGLLDAVLLAALPLLILNRLLDAAFASMASTGIQGLGWAALVVRPWFWMTAGAMFMLQWWLCRIARAGRGGAGGRWGTWKALGHHLEDSFLRLWRHPVQWGLLSLGGVLVRFGLAFGALFLAWRWGGGTPGRVWTFLLLQALAAALVAWITGWLLRLSGLFWRHDDRVRTEIRTLQGVAAGRPVPEA